MDSSPLTSVSGPGQAWLIGSWVGSGMGTDLDGDDALVDIRTCRTIHTIMGYRSPRQRGP
jgi:hypothetical protein